jgi:hypothetical protein
MYLLYVDESGDTGLSKSSPTKYFILTGLIIHETHWLNFLRDLVTFRRHLRATKGLKLREEIHAGPFITRPGDLARIKRNDRVHILRQCIDWLGNRTDINIITVAVNKTGRAAPYDVFEKAWQALIQRFENTIKARNFPGGFADQRGLILPDNTDGQKLQRLMRQMRHYNPVPSQQTYQPFADYRNMKITSIIEDPFMKDSEHSLLLQMVDVIAYMARQLYEPNAYMRKQGGHNFYQRLQPIINPHATRKHALHIVEL